jgi:anti-sigma factor RsiW
MNCTGALALLEAYLDGELDASQNAEVARHLSECESCGTAHQRLRGLSNDLRTLAPRYEASDDLRRRVLSGIQQVAGKAPARHTMMNIRMNWLALAATLLLAVSAGWNVMLLQKGKSAGAEVAQEIVSSHIHSLIGDHLLDVASSDQHNVKPWFNGKLDYSPDVKDFAAEGFSLIGGRVDYVNRRPVAALVYRRRQHVINLFVWPDGSAVNMPASANGFNLVSWNRDGMTYCAVSDLNDSELRQFADLYR